MTAQRCLVMGASGYIGGRLVPELLSAGHSVRCMARRPGNLRDQPWAAEVEVAEADAMAPVPPAGRSRALTWSTTSSTG